MYVEEEFCLNKEDKTSEVAKDIGVLIEKIRANRDLKIKIIIEEDKMSYFYNTNSGGTTSDSKFW